MSIVPGAIEIATDRAIPIALVVTELVTNAAKYAYPDGMRRPHLVRLGQRDDGRVRSVGGG